MVSYKKLLQSLLIVSSASVLLACAADGGDHSANAGVGGGPGGVGSGSGSADVSTNDGYDADGNATGTGSNTDAAFSNDPLSPNGAEVSGGIYEAGVDGNGDPVDNEVAYGTSGKRFMCLASANLAEGATSDVTVNGIVGGTASGALDFLGADSVNAMLNSVKDQTLAIDSELTTASVYTMTASLLEVIGGGQIVDSIEQVISLPVAVSDYAVAAISFPAGAVDLGLLRTVTVTTYLDVDGEFSAEPSEPPVSVDASSLDLLGQGVVNPGQIFVGRKVTSPYNRVHVALQGDFVSADLGEAMYLHEVCTDGTLVDVPVAP